MALLTTKYLTTYNFNLANFHALTAAAAMHAAPWARATKNVKKPVSHVEKLDLRFLQNKPETFSVSVTHLILRLPYQ